MFEKVNPSHPDKVADRIAGAIVDLAYHQSETPKVACEVLIGHGECLIIIESDCDYDKGAIEEAVARIAREKVSVNLKIVPQDVHLAKNQDGEIRCGDNGIFRGCYPTKEQITLTMVASEIYKKWNFDGKYIIDNSCCVVCQSNMTDLEANSLKNSLINRHGFSDVKINPIGEWTGGLSTDSGATNRKLGSDMGDGVTGGGLHGKDLSKADVSVNIWCFLESIKRKKTITARCSIGSEFVNGISYKDIVKQAREYITAIGGFEKFAEWGLIRP